MLIRKAKRGDSQVQLELGDIYSCDLNIESDFKKAYYWYKKAAKSNLAAKHRLAMCTYYGDGTNENYQEALAMFRELVKLDYIPANLEYCEMILDHPEEYEIYHQLAKSSLPSIINTCSINLPEAIEIYLAYLSMDLNFDSMNFI